MNAQDLFFKPEPKQQSNKRRVWNIKKTKSALGPDTCSNILFVHAFLGCDTTSRVNGIGKAQSMKQFKNSQQFGSQAKVFNSDASNISKDELVAAGERALLYLYNGNSESLDELRSRKNSTKRYPLELHLYSLKVFLQHLMLQASTVCESHSSLLEVIRCNCKAECSTRRCSCRKNSLECSTACGTCQGVSCTNSQKPELTDEHSQV